MYSFTEVKQVWEKEGLQPIGWLEQCRQLSSHNKNMEVSEELMVTDGQLMDDVCSHMDTYKWAIVSSLIWHLLGMGIVSIFMGWSTGKNVID